MESPLFLLGLAIFPVVFLCIYIYMKDRYKKEPWKMLFKALFFGILSVVPTIFVEQYLSSLNTCEGMNHALYNAFVVAGFTEETFKFLFLYIVIWNNRYFDEYFDGIVYAVFVSLGFALVENIMYVMQTGLSTGIGRAIFSVPGHFLFGVVMGYFFALAKFSRKNGKKFYYLLLSLIIPMLLHGIFDGILMIRDMAKGIEGLLLVIFIFFDIKLWKIGKKKMDELEGY